MIKGSFGGCLCGLGQCRVPDYGQQNDPRCPFVSHQTPTNSSWAGIKYRRNSGSPSLSWLIKVNFDWQIAPFQVDFAVKEMSLDFSSVKSAGMLFLCCNKRAVEELAHICWCFLAALGLFQKKGRLFSLSASNALLEFLLEGAPQVREHLKGTYFCE